MKRLIITLSIVSIFGLQQILGQTRYLTVEPNHSTIGFEIPIAGGITTVTGKFIDFDLELELIDGDWTNTTVKFTIQVSSINTGIDGRDNDLQSENFFHVQKYRKITFISNRIVSTQNKSYEAAGTFTMHGVEKEIILPFEVVSEDGNTIGVKIETSINRKDYGVGSGWQHSAIPNFLGDDVAVKIFFWTKADKRKVAIK